jgi:hypothetical protein
MALVIVNQGEEDFLDLVLAVTYDLKLFKTDVTAGLTDEQVEALDEGDFTEATFGGYADATITGGSWTTTPADPSFATYAAQTFTQTDGIAQTIYGYYVTRASDGALEWFEEFAGGPITVTNVGDAITVIPRMTLDDGEDTSMFARGVIAQEALTANSTGYTVDTTTDMNLDNVPVVAGRIYAICLDVPYSISAAAQWALDCNINGSLFGRFGWVLSDASENGHISGRVWWEPSVTASTDDIAVVANEVSGAGTLTLNGSATAPRSLTLIDMGLAP